MAEGVATKEQVKRISDNVQAALQVRARPHAMQHACLNPVVHPSVHVMAGSPRSTCSACSEVL